MNEIYVGNLPYRISEDELRNFFSEFGEITKLKIITDRDTGRSKGFAFVAFASADGAKRAIEKANGKDLNGRTIRVNESRGTSGAGSAR